MMMMMMPQPEKVATKVDRCLDGYDTVYMYVLSDKTLIFIVLALHLDDDDAPTR